MLTFTELWEKLVSQDETVEIEAKSASEIGKSILETVSAFANEPGRGGGYLILGVESSEDNTPNEYKIIGLSNPDKIQRDLATQCREVFNIPIRPQIEVSTEEGKTVIVVFIPEAQLPEKPVYLLRKGLPKGAFRRIASTDQKCTDFESSKEKDSFTTKLLVHHFLGSADIEWLAQFKHCSLSDDEARALIVLREVGEINNFIYRLINCVDPLTASQRLRRLRDAGLLEQQGKGSATYYTLHSDLRDSGLSSEFSEQSASNLESSSTDKALSIEFSSTDKDSYLNQMPEHLQQAVQNLGKRAKHQEVSSVIIALCQWRNFSSRELSTIINNSVETLHATSLQSGT